MVYQLYVCYTIEKIIFSNKELLHGLCTGQSVHSAIVYCAFERHGSYG